MPDAQWQTILGNVHFQPQINNLVKESLETGYCKAELKVLAAAIALWRLSMLSREGVAPTEYLLHCMLAGPFKSVLEKHGIHVHVCVLIRLLAVQNRLSQNQLVNPAEIFPGLPGFPLPK